MILHERLLRCYTIAKYDFRGQPLRDQAHARCSRTQTALPIRTASPKASAVGPRNPLGPQMIASIVIVVLVMFAEHTKTGVANKDTKLARLHARSSASRRATQAVMEDVVSSVQRVPQYFCLGKLQACSRSSKIESTCIHQILQGKATQRYCANHLVSPMLTTHLYRCQAT